MQENKDRFLEFLKKCINKNLEVTYIKIYESSLGKKMMAVRVVLGVKLEKWVGLTYALENNNFIWG